jgi:two-component system phosphate regulon sensor histidine kinase PhoR
MTQELLDLARIEAAPSTHPTVFDPGLAVCEVVERMRTLANGKRLQLTAEPVPTVPEVRADRDQVCRVLVNLLNNAIKFTPEGGQVCVSSYLEPDAVAISVSDTGPGIPAGEESRIFERFYKVDTARQRGGTGLGLSIARHIVEAQGGEIWVRNRPEGGACFTFTLPVDGAAAEHS